MESDTSETFFFVFLLCLLVQYLLDRTVLFNVFFVCEPPRPFAGLGLNAMSFSATSPAAAGATAVATGSAATGAASAGAAAAATTTAAAAAAVATTGGAAGSAMAAISAAAATIAGPAVLVVAPIVGIAGAIAYWQPACTWSNGQAASRFGFEGFVGVVADALLS